MGEGKQDARSLYRSSNDQPNYPAYKQQRVYCEHSDHAIYKIHRVICLTLMSIGCLLSETPSHDYYRHS